jgi:hypothetical protein
MLYLYKFNLIAIQSISIYSQEFYFFILTFIIDILIITHRTQRSQLNTTDVAKMVSKAWKNLPEDERAKWEEIAKQDKARYEMEKSTYTGPWKVAVAKQKKKNKDTGAPKRPMSAFLAFLHSNRKDVKNKHKDATNTDISRILAKMWKDADMIEKEFFITEESQRRQEYKEAMSKWKMRQGEEMKMMREERECGAMASVREGELPSISRTNDVHTRSVSLSSDSTMESSVSDTTTTVSYSTQLAADIFAPPTTSISNPYPPHSKPYSMALLPSSSNQQQQYPPPTLYNYNHHHHEERLSLDAYNQNTHDYTNSCETHSIYEHQAVFASNSNANTNDGGGQQQYPYGYGPPPPYYNQQGTMRACLLRTTSTVSICTFMLSQRFPFFLVSIL